MQVIKPATGELRCGPRQTGYNTQALTTTHTASHQQKQCGWTCDACREGLELHLERKRHQSLQDLARHIEKSGVHTNNSGEPLKGLKQENGTSQVVLVVKNPPANAGDTRDVGSIPGLGKSPGGGHGNPPQYSCLENPTNRGAWRATVHRVSKCQTRQK